MSLKSKTRLCRDPAVSGQRILLTMTIVWFCVLAKAQTPSNPQLRELHHRGDKAIVYRRAHRKAIPDGLDDLPTWVC